MHSTNLPPAGRGIELDTRPDGVYLRARICEPTAAKLVREGVYKAYSVGISHARVERDLSAKGGRVVDGTIVEVSLVDRPANPQCKVELVKGADWVEKVVDLDTPLEKKDYSDSERKDLADKGQALPDGSFPIKTKADLQNAISSIGRAADYKKAQAHIIAQAKALGATDMLPPGWTGSTNPKKATKAAKVEKKKKAAKKLRRQIAALMPPQQASGAMKIAHDLTCPAYSNKSLVRAYPLLKNGVAYSFGPVAVSAIYSMLANEVQEDGGSGTQSADIDHIASAYFKVCQFLAGEVAEDDDGDLGSIDSTFASVHAQLHKAFKAANPMSDPPAPNLPPQPGRFNRPLITDGRASASATHHDYPIHTNGGVSPGQFDRGYLGAGRQAQAPSGGGGPMQHAIPADSLAAKAAATGKKPNRKFYRKAGQAEMAQHLQGIHDHITAMDSSVCPMDNSSAVSVPAKTARPEKGKKMAKTKIEKAVRRALEAARQEAQEQFSTMQAKIEKLESAPAPQESPLRGVAGVPPREEAAVTTAARDDGYWKQAAATADPGTRMAAIAELIKQANAEKEA